MEYSSQSYRRSSLASSSSASGPTAFYLRRHSRSVLQKRKVTIILIFCLFVALLLWTPQSLSLTYETMIESYSDMSQDHRIILLIFNNFANLFVCLNASIDFILYCFLSEKFARTCRQIICRQCTVHENKTNHRSRIISVDRTSFIAAQAPTNLHHQQLAANKTNKYYVQLYDIYRNSSGMKNQTDKKWKKKLTQSLPTNMKNDNRIFYQKSLTRHKPREQYATANNVRANVVSNPILEYVDDDKINEETNGSVETLTTSPMKWCSLELFLFLLLLLFETINVHRRWSRWFVQLFGSDVFDCKTWSVNELIWFFHREERYPVDWTLLTSDIHGLAMFIRSMA